MYGGKFIQRYGWYYKQTYFRLGIFLWGGIFLDDVCPEEIKKDYLNSVKVGDEYRRCLRDVNEKRQMMYKAEDTIYWRERYEELKKLHRKSSQALRVYTKKIENITRQEFGIRNVGEGWVSESILAQMINRILNKYQIIRHYRPEWLEGLELDIYVPELSLAFEYQGQQHFYPIVAWGGKEALAKLQERDIKKKKLCKNLGIKLITVNYTDPLTEDYIKSLIREYI